MGVQRYLIDSKVLFISHFSISETGMYLKTDGILDSEENTITIKSIEEIQHVTLTPEQYNNKH